MTDKFDDAMNEGYMNDLGFRDLRARMNKAFADNHGKRIAAREAINGQPNGYRPVTEAELQAQRAELFSELEPDINPETKIVSVLDPNFGKVKAA